MKLERRHPGRRNRLPSFTTTYGFPVDLTADVCRERNIKVDEAGFEAAMKEQRRRARESGAVSAPTT